jgi:MFS family permease
MTARRDWAILPSSSQEAWALALRHAMRKFMTMMRTELVLTATRTWIGFGLMCLGMFMAILDIQVVATSLPTIQNALAISPEAMSWIQTVFILFRPRTQGIATTIAGIMAVLAPTVGPVIGGWITQVYSWHWLFLINVIPGLITCAITPYLLPRKNTNFEGAKLDGLSLFLMAAALACLEIGLKQSPQGGWSSVACISLFYLSALTGGFFVW